METLNLLFDFIIVCYIIIKEMNAINRFINNAIEVVNEFIKYLFVKAATNSDDSIYFAMDNEVIDDDIFGERDDSPIIDPNATIIDVDINLTKDIDEQVYVITMDEEEIAEEYKDDITLIQDEIEAGVIDKKFLKLLLNINIGNINNIDKVFYAGVAV